MKLLILLALCGTVALSPVQMNTEDFGKPPCEPQTPCGWSIYNPHTKEIINNIPNKYCYCQDPLSCLLSEDDTAVNSYIRRCRTKDTELVVSAR